MSMPSLIFEAKSMAANEKYFTLEELATILRDNPLPPDWDYKIETHGFASQRVKKLTILKGRLTVVPSKPTFAEGDYA